MINIAYIGDKYTNNMNRVHGGSSMTVHCLFKSFENDKEFKLTSINRNRITNKKSLLNAIKGFDLFHLDDTKVANIALNNNIIPDVIGVVTRSPVKDYNGWKAPYSPGNFYKSEVIRLNEAEERTPKYLKKINFIIHGVDMDFLKPKPKKRKYVLWAGQTSRYAKNYEVFKRLMETTKLPNGFYFKVLDKYKVKDYWNILDETAILVNTSRYESFCCAMFEAKAKQVPTIYKKGLHGKIMNKSCEIQVDYSLKGYRNKILELLNGDFEYEGKKSRWYVLKNNTLKHMRDSIAKIYKKAYDKRKGKSW